MSLECTQYLHLLSREDIIRTLVERELKIANLNQMPFDQLLQIYKSFAVPLAKRVLKKDCQSQANVAADLITDTEISPSTSKSYSLKRNLDMQAVSSDPKTLKLTLNSVCKKTKTDIATPTNGDIYGHNTNGIAPKRKKITWP